jgi:hypothetical protein
VNSETIAAIVGAAVGGGLTWIATWVTTKQQWRREARLRHLERLEDAVVELRIVCGELSVRSEVDPQYADLLARSRWLLDLVSVRARSRHEVFSLLLDRLHRYHFEALEMVKPDGSLTDDGDRQSRDALGLMAVVVHAWLENPDEVRRGSPLLEELEELLEEQKVPHLR